MAPTVSTIAPSAREIASRHRMSESGALNLRPVTKSEISTAASVTCSSTVESLIGSRCSSATPAGPNATPAARYSMDGLTGKRFNSAPVIAMVISNNPRTTAQIAKVIGGGKTKGCARAPPHVSSSSRPPLALRLALPSGKKRPRRVAGSRDTCLRSA
jgi:hypothetical protein